MKTPGVSFGMVDHEKFAEDRDLVDLVQARCPFPPGWSRSYHHSGRWVIVVRYNVKRWTKRQEGREYMVWWWVARGDRRWAEPGRWFGTRERSWRWAAASARSELNLTAEDIEATMGVGA